MRPRSASSSSSAWTSSSTSDSVMQPCCSPRSISAASGPSEASLLVTAIPSFVLTASARTVNARVGAHGGVWREVARGTPVTDWRGQHARTIQASSKSRGHGSVATDEREREASRRNGRADGTTRRMPSTDDDRTVGDRTATADDDRTVATTAPQPTTAPWRRRTVADDRAPATVARTRDGVASAAALETARARQRDEFGGVNWGASFFGWLVAVGVAALLTALLAAAGAAVGLTATTESDADGERRGDRPRRRHRAAVVLMIAYYAGGYVAGRMSRFDGGRQGLGTWAIGLVVTVAARGRGRGPRRPVQRARAAQPAVAAGGRQTLATGGIIALAAIVSARSSPRWPAARSASATTSKRRSRRFID